MEIQITPSQQQRLALHAQAAGYANVEAFVAAQLDDLASQPTTDELPLVDETAAQEMNRRGEKDITAGRVRDMRNALTELGERRGYAAE